MEGSDTLDAHEAGLALVALRTYFSPPLHQHRSHFYRKPGQREWSTSVHGKIDYAETQSESASVPFISSTNAFPDADQCT